MAMAPHDVQGNARQAIFGDDRDRVRLTERVGESAEVFDGNRFATGGAMHAHREAGKM
jgi:hypothetical protein